MTSESDSEGMDKKSENKEGNISELKNTEKFKLMTIEKRSVHFSRISIVFHNDILHPVIYLLDIGAGPNLIKKYFLPPHSLPKIIDSTTKTLSSAAKGPLQTLGQVSRYLRTLDITTATTFTEINLLAANLLFVPTIIDGHVLAILPEER